MVAIARHGLSIGIERIHGQLFLTLKVVGKLLHSDYSVIAPMIESALQGVDNPKIKVFIDCVELEGWEVRAAWDDFKLGLKHGGKFTHVAILGNKRWQKLGAKIGAWFIATDVRYFENIDDALQWLQESEKED